MGVNSGSFTLFANLLGIIGIIIAIAVSILFVYSFIWICILAYRAFTPLVERVVIRKEPEDRPRDRKRVSGLDDDSTQSQNHLLSLVHRL